MSLSYILWANIIFFLLETFCLLLITYYCFKQEEVRDCQKLALLTNTIKKKQAMQLDQQRLYLKMRYLGINKTQDDHDRTFSNQLNLLRLEALRLWFTPEERLDTSELTVRM